MYVQNESPIFGLLRALQAIGSSHVGGIDLNNCIDVDGHKVLEGRNIMDVETSNHRSGDTASMWKC
jgi:hypothetical protein